MIPPNQWYQKNDFMGNIRHHPVTFAIDGIGYAGVGNEGSVTYEDFYKYDPQSDRWTKLNNFGGGTRGYAYGVAYNGKAYVGFGSREKKVFNDLWEYSPTTDSWKELTPCPCEPRTHPAMVAVNGKVYVGTGGGITDNLKDWWEYDTASNRWTQKADLPGPARHHPFYFAINGMAYVGFGHGTEVVNGQIIYQDFYQYNPQTEKWKRMNDFPEMGRVAGTQFDYNGYGYILSGHGTNHKSMQTGEFWEYNPQTDNWKSLNPHKGKSRWAPGSFVINDKVYLTCGQSSVGENLRDIQIFGFK